MIAGNGPTEKGPALAGPFVLPDKNALPAGP